MRDYIYSLMTDKKNGIAASIIKGVLSVISWFYGALSSFVKFAYKTGVLKSKKVDCKVISVGNISLGGTGKTPNACMLAKRLKGQKKMTAVLTRGYGDDEWKMMKDQLGDIPVLVGPDRVKNSKYAVSEFGVDTVVLDDGFQHWKIKRDLDIVLIDSSNPFGNGCLFPRGVLRETPRALSRANILMLTKTDMGKKNLEWIKDQLRRIVPDTPVLESIYNPKDLYRLADKEKVKISQIKDKSVAALSSVVNSGYFVFILKNSGADVKIRFDYPDHYNYKQEDLKYIIEECEKNGIDTIVTTEKDAVKLSAISCQLSANTFLVLRIEQEVTKGEEILDRRLVSLYRD